MGSFLSVPAEGVTLEYLARPIGAILLQPVLTGGLLLLQNVDRAKALLSILFKGRNNHSGFNITLRTLCAVGLLWRGNRLLNQLAANNYTRDNTYDWNKEIVLITGGARGMGEIMARKFAKRNIKVVVWDVSPPTTALPPNVTFFQVNIRDSKAVSAAAENVRKQVGHPTVLINNAGVSGAGPLLDSEEEDIHRVFEVNTISHFYICREFLPYMVERNHGHVVTIASMSSYVVISGNIDYSCAKMSALGFHEGLHQELKHRYNAPRVRTTIVYPYWMRTPMVAPLLEKPGFKEFVLEPETVANEVMDHVFKAQGGHVVLPRRFAWLVPSLRAFPLWFQEGIKDMMTDPLKPDDN